MPHRLIANVRTISELESIQVPDSWRDADRLDMGVYHIIPTRLWNLVSRDIGRDRFSDQDIVRELELATAAGEHYHNVAIKNGAFVVYADLDPMSPVVLGTNDAEALGKTMVQADHLSRKLTEKLAAINGPRRGYLGWLLTNPRFLDEHDRLVRNYEREIRHNGFPQPRTSSRQRPNTIAPEVNDWVLDCRQFYARWCLQSMLSAYLPIPLPFLAPVVNDPATGSRSEGTFTISIPSYYPTRGRGLMHEIIEDGLRGQGPPDHLAEWSKIVQRSSMAVNVVSMYDRWFRLQHFWRLLHRRYPEQMRRHKNLLIGVFSQFLGVSVDTVKSDIRRITTRLSQGWESRFACCRENE